MQFVRMPRMQRTDFYFELPDELIAQQPASERTGSRLLCLDAAVRHFEDHQFTDFPDLLREGDLLVFNNTRVIPARLHAHKASGGKVEILVERVVSEHEVLAHVRASKSPKPGGIIVLENGLEITMLEREGALFKLGFPLGASAISVIESIGHMPLPPYIQRDDNEVDQERYQTVYASQPGAVAAPTAGLHFDAAMMDTLKQKGIRTAEVTLHVGAGTFQPVKVDDIREHPMHSEYLEVSEDTVAAIEATRQRGGRVIAIGTTSVRSLESAARDGILRPYQGETDIFIYPGYEFRVIDAMLTNFHLPESTLLMLVSAFAGREFILDAYRHAVEEKYRFFSYGDAMFISKD